MATGLALKDRRPPSTQGAAQPCELRRVAAGPLDELSGIVAGNTRPSTLWAHNDSGDTARLFALSPDGQGQGEVTVNHAENVDWEDLARGEGSLFIGDFGNNRSTRRDLVVYRVPEPRSDQSQINPSGRFPFRYPDQDLEAPGRVKNFDCEAMIYSQGTLFFFSKHREDLDTTIYRLPSLDSQQPQVLEKLGSFHLGGADHRYGGMATAADLNEDGTVLALLSYHALFLFSWDPVNPPGDLLRRIELDEDRARQAEAIAWWGEDLLIANEQRDLYRLPIPLTGPAGCLESIL